MGGRWDKLLTGPGVDLITFRLFSFLQIDFKNYKLKTIYIGCAYKQTSDLFARGDLCYLSAVKTICE